MEINGKKYNFNEKKTDISFNDLGVNDKKLKNIFDHFDKNKDGKLSAQELDKAFSVFAGMDNTKGVSDNKLTDEEITSGILALPKSVRISVDAMKSFIAKLVVVNNGKNVAENIHEQISGPSWYKNTKEKLQSINKYNVVEVWGSYSKLSKQESLASAIDNELMLDVAEVKQYVCKPLVERAKSLGIKCADYSKLDKIDAVNSFIETTVKKINDVEGKKLKNDLKKDLPYDPTDYPQYANVKSYITNIAKKRKTTLSDAEVENITKMVLLTCKKYNISEISPVIAQILGTESSYVFDARSMNANPLYKGVMQVDYETCCCILSMREPKTIGKETYGEKKTSDYEYWHGLHFNQDDALIEKIKAKYHTPSELYEALKTDVQLSFEVGILAFKSKLSETNGDVSEAIAKYCGSNYACDLSKIPANYKVK